MKRQFKIVERFAARTTSIDKYFNDVNDVGSAITPEEENVLAIKALDGDEKAREKLIHANLRFVISVAKAYANRDIKLEDLINEGNYGLIEASYKFDPTTGFKFISYAVWYIRKEMFKYITNCSRIVRLPQHSVLDLNKINNAMDRVRSREQIEPTISMVLDELDKIGKVMTEASVLRVLNTNAAIAPLEGDSSNPDDPRPLSWLSSKDNNPMDLINDSDFITIKRVLFKNLSDREQYILTKRLGLDGTNAQSFREIGERFKVTPQTISNSYTAIIVKLKYAAKEIDYTP